MRRAVLTVGLALSIGCCLGVSASATIDLAAAHNLSAWARPMLVGSLELLSLGCAWGWVTSTDTLVKVEFAAVMALASAVSIVGGVQSYQWLGVVAPLAMVAAVHVTSRMWLAANHGLPDRTPITTGPEPASVASGTDAVPGLSADPAPSSRRAQPAATPEVAEVPSAEPTPAPPRADNEPEPEPGVDARVREIAELLAAGAGVTGAQAAAMHGCSQRTGRRLLADARTHLEATTTTGHALRLVGPTTEEITA